MTSLLPKGLMGWILLALPGLGLVCLMAGGVYLYRVAAHVLTVGPVAEMLEARGRPSAPLAMGYRGDPGRALGLAFELVHVPTELGPAPAWFFPADDGNDLAALYVHGIAGARENGYRYLAPLRAAGIATLLISYRNDPGAPPSPDRIYAFGLTEWRDLEAAASVLGERGYRRLLLIGDSMGGAIIGQFLRRSASAGAVVAIALDSPALELRDVLARLASSMWLPGGRGLAAIALPLLKASSPYPLGEASVTEVLADFAGPLFLAHGTADRLVPIGSSDRLLRRRRGTTITLRTDADHLLSHAADPDAFERAFAGFLGMVD